MAPSLFWPNTPGYLRCIKFLYRFNSPKGYKIVPGKPLQRTDKEFFPVEGPGRCKPPFDYRKHIFWFIQIVPVEGMHTINFFFVAQIYHLLLQFPSTLSNSRGSTITAAAAPKIAPRVSASQSQTLQSRPGTKY